ncbi:hypothetical protein CDD80_4705 [Ophiocordyceps camponoti-rufipedis]|uniref:CoA-transferase family III domain-containing protein n=1 Tax=Ophiocordyceps camponoti-rufipedis TaxID=2004952 RepID=A0A2C5YN10_9HYPO|nr:hypothetical protein CDD80_4705 [Ophiocordyceps camponoti-rufipedis]
MAPQSTVKGVYGPGTYTDTSFTPLPKECQRLLKYFAENTPGFTKDAKDLDVNFHGDDLPMIPGPLKSQAASAVFHAMIGIVGKEISKLKGIDTGKISIDTDKSGLYPATPGLVIIDGKTLEEIQGDGTITKVGKDLDHHVLDRNHLLYRSWSIYPTKDPKVYYQIMGNLHPVDFLKAYDIDPEAPTSSLDEAYEIIKKKISQYSARELEQKNMEHGFCGQTCFSPEQWRQTTMGQSLAAHPILNYNRVPETPDLPPVPFPQTEDKRPLAGIKVIELGRVIASPALGAALASLGADVIKVQSPNLPDLQPLSVQLTADKRTYALDLTKEDDKKKLHELFADADVILQAFRIRSLERKGFGLNDVLAMANKRNKGIVYIDLNCYGPDGYYAERPGFQQIADAASGCTYVCGKAYGFDEGVSVLPSLPIADMLSGAAGVVNVLLALRDRATKGGSYHSTMALTAVDAVQLEEEFGLYQPEVVKKIQDRYSFKPMTPDLHVGELLGNVVSAWASRPDASGKSSILGRDGYMAKFSTPWSDNHQILSPIVEYENQSISPRWIRGPTPYCYHENVKWA